MIDFLKQRKIVIIIGFLAIIIIGWKIYDSFNYDEIKVDETLNSTVNNSNLESDEENIIAIHIIGEVKKTGVVRIKEGSRIENVVEAAGGLTEKADISKVNLAYPVEDGMKIRIPSIDDDMQNEYILEGGGDGVIVSDEAEESSIVWVNINTADENELEKLPGIGASIATRIVDYRKQNGKFKSIEDIKNVTGIGDSKFEKIKDLIKVK